MQEVNIYLLNDIKSPGRKSTGTYIYVLEMKNPNIKGSMKGVKTVNDVTANQLELMSLTEALKRFNRKCAFDIYMASPYLMGALDNDWPHGWKVNGWKTSGGKDVSYRHEWEELLTALEGHLVTMCELSPAQRNMLEAEMYRDNKKIS